MLSDQSRLEGDRLDSFGRRQPRRQYVPDPCSGGRAPRFSATVAAADTDEDDADEGLYNCRHRSSPNSVDDEGSSRSDDTAIVEMAQHGDVFSGRTVSDVPTTLPGPHLANAYGTSSISSGTGNSRVIQPCLFLTDI